MVASGRRIWAGPLALVLLLWAALAAAQGFVLAERYDGGLELSRYMVSEKLDGVRAQWDGRQLLSRNGNAFAAPGWFVAGFPAMRLDGELWAGRGTFERLSGIVRRAAPHEGWRDVRFMVFDAPDVAGDFGIRLARLRAAVEAAAIPHLQLVAQERVPTEAQLHQRLDATAAGGGEGLMLRRIDAPYRAGRSDDLIKLKPYMDAEARVVAHNPSESGKYAGLMGSITVENADGLRFRIGTGFSDRQRRNPPPIGATITYKYHGHTNSGLPRFPSYLRLRNDGPPAAAEDK